MAKKPIKNIIQLSNELRWQIGDDFHDNLAEGIYADAAEIVNNSVQTDSGKKRFRLDSKIDKIITSRTWGFPLMFIILGVVLWLTIVGANYPSGMLAELLLDTIHPALKSGASSIGMPWWFDGFLIDGVYLAVAWVIAVMLPPMAIFFPLFTLLEDFGYLPRVAFNLDALFKKSGAHGKQALTMSMGFGCNAAGVIATRIIDSPRERLIAIITNNFSLCNGRWPTQILIATIFIGAVVPKSVSGLASVGAVIGIAVLGMVFMFFSSWALSKTVLKGEVSTFNLELPPYRPPRFWKTLYTSLIDRTLIGFCSPTHGFNSPPILVKFIRKFPYVKNADVFILNTRAGLKLHKLFIPGLSGLAQILPALILKLKGYRIFGMQPLDLPSNWISVHPGLRKKVVNSIYHRCYRIVNSFALKMIS